MNEPTSLATGDGPADPGREVLAAAGVRRTLNEHKAAHAARIQQLDAQSRAYERQLEEEIAALEQAARAPGEG